MRRNFASPPPSNPYAYIHTPHEAEEGTYPKMMRMTQTFETWSPGSGSQTLGCLSTEAWLPSQQTTGVDVLRGWLSASITSGFGCHWLCFVP